MDKQSVKLRLEGINLHFGGVMALNSVSADIKEGELLAIIGPNGAGKTSVLNCICGFYKPNSGRIYFEGTDITRLPSHKRPYLGMARTLQNIRLYSGMTVLDNLMAARHIHMHHNLITAAFFFGPARRQEIIHRKRVEDIIDFLDLEPIRKKIVGSLSYGQQKLVDLGRALAMEPKLLLLDEPMAGMNVEEKEDMARFILDIHELENTSIVLVEHDMGVVMDISKRVIVLDFGAVIAEGKPEEIKVNPEVIKAYLGKRSDEKEKN